MSPCLLRCYPYRAREWPPQPAGGRAGAIPSATSLDGGSDCCAQRSWRGVVSVCSACLAGSGDAGCCGVRLPRRPAGKARSGVGRVEQPGGRHRFGCRRPPHRRSRALTPSVCSLKAVCSVAGGHLTGVAADEHAVPAGPARQYDPDRIDADAAALAREAVPGIGRNGGLAGPGGSFVFLARSSSCVGGLVASAVAAADRCSPADAIGGRVSRCTREAGTRHAMPLSSHEALLSRPFGERAWLAAVPGPAYRGVPVRNAIRFRTMVAARPASAAHDRRAGLRPGVGVENRPWAAVAGDCRRPWRPGGERSGAQRGCVPPGVARVSSAPAVSLYSPLPPPPARGSSFPRRFREARPNPRFRGG